MNIVVIGSGYVGITVVCLADFGHNITVLGRDRERTNKINRGISPIFEPGAGEVLQRNLSNGRLKATTDYSVVKDADAVFICVGTPSNEDGSIDLSQIESCSNSIGEQLRNSEKYKIIIVKSTVLPKTTKDFVVPILEKFSGKRAGKDFGVCMNPEFLREGLAVYDFINPDKIVIGGIDEKSKKFLADIYSGFDEKIPRVFTDTNTAEMIKYANNAMLATRISFINEFANICEHYNADVYEVAHAIGLDSRIGPKFLNAGAGFGGSCFPKDVSAIVSAAKSVGIDPTLMNSVLEVNDKQPLRMVDLAEKTIGDLTDKKISVLGLAFKPDTDDMRYSRAIPVIQTLLRKHAKVKAYDPQAMENAKEIFGDMVTFCDSTESCISDSDLILIMTEWGEFKNLDILKINVPVIDGRRALNPEKVLQQGIVYKGIGWKNNFGGAQ